MLPSLLACEITEALKQFIITGYETPTPFFDGLFTRFVDQPGNLFKGPYLSLGLPFQKGHTGRDFFPGFETQYPPFVHQERAWQRLSSSGAAQSALIATGTGSGKTECFLYPLLDHCLREHEAGHSRGIKAIVIYPMNALAGDQAQRFAQTIYRCAALRGRLTVGLFVGEGEHSPNKTMTEDSVITDKDTLRTAPPDILLTNYKMLDYLLIRPKDRALWRDNGPEILRYIVVDELHTFDGAQGTDLACLLRRLRARLHTPTERLIAVGTSATLGSDSEQAHLAEYASKIFQTRFDEHAIIGERRQSSEQFLGSELIEFLFDPPDDLAEQLDPYRYASLADFLTAQYRLFFPEQPPAQPHDPAWCAALGRQLKRHLLFNNLLRRLEHQPRLLAELGQELAGNLPKRSRDQTVAVLNSLCALIACARDPQTPDLPLVQLRLQLWVRELRRMVTRLTSDADSEKPSLAFADDLKQQRDELYLPLVQCNECHATAWATVKPATKGQIEKDLRSIYNGFFSHSPDLLLLFPLKGDESAPAAPGVERKLCGHCGQLQNDDTHCLACGEEPLQRVFCPDNNRQRQRNGVQRLINEHNCPVCGAKNNLMVFGARATSLASVAIHQGYASAYNDDKKLIAFSDSVQDAAHRAGFFTARTWQNNVRMAIAQAFAGCGHETLPLTEFYDFMPRYWSDPTLNPQALAPERYATEFIAPNMLWLQDYQALCEQGKLPKDSRLLDDINRRLQWEVLAEFGYRARIGRSLERTGCMALGIELEPIAHAAEVALVPLREELGLRDLSQDELQHFMLGMLLRLKERGGIYHPLLDGYIENEGRNYLISDRSKHVPSFMPTFGERSPAPIFLCDARRHAKFDTFTPWYQNWCQAVLGRDRLLPDRLEADIIHVVLQALVDAGALSTFRVNRGERVWALNPAQLYLSNRVARLADAQGRGQKVVPAAMREALTGMPILAGKEARGEYQALPDRNHWLSRLYRQGEIHRVLAAEHTGLLEREAREKLEKDFIAGANPWAPNLLSATPTLEMGINIGDLSSVLLCSVPPNQANYLQRIGRAGRRDGNAFNLTVAAGRPHDLYFYAEPKSMMAGQVEPPGVFLDASAVIERQLVAYCLDCWVASGIDASAIPHTLKPVLDSVEQGHLQRFPYNLIDFVKQNAPDLLDGFLELFAGELSKRTIAHLRQQLLGEDPEQQDLEQLIVHRLYELVQERKRLKSRIDALKRHGDRLEKQPQDEATAEELNEVRRERSGLQSVLRAINGRETLNFFTDEGLIPNYAFPEAGVTLRSVIYRRRSESAEGDGDYENTVYEYERPGVAAIGELAPENHFYADGRRVKITQVDLGLSDIETWRFCPSCAHAENLAVGDHQPVCPRCAEPMWADSGQRVQMVRLRQVMAKTSDRDSRIGDDADDREPTFYTKQMLADFQASDIELAHRIASDSLPFGFEFIRKTHFREVNFGEYGGADPQRVIAGKEASRPGFRLCRHCGTVQDRRGHTQQHAFSCKSADQQAPDNVVDCLYLYREFTSEAIRILLPTGATDEGAERTLHSFIAALQLGLRKRFGGQVDHLRMMAYDEPVAGSDARRHYLMLYDSVPGGTGYLRALLLDYQQLVEVFRLARDTLKVCECNAALHEEKDGCYKCLYAYRNSYGMEKTSRNTAVTLLNSILELADRFEAVPSIGGGAPVNPVLESELEVRFIEAIRRCALNGLEVQVQSKVVDGKPGYFLRAGKHYYDIVPQVALNERDGVHYASKPDFLIRSARSADDFKPVAVFMDGFRFHRDKVTEDSAKRLALVQSDCFWQWSLTWQDVNSHFAGNASQIRNPLTEGLYADMQALQSKLATHLGIEPLQRIHMLGSLEQLLHFLSEPQPRRWAALAALRCLSWFEQQTMRTDDTRTAFMDAFMTSAVTWLSQCLENRSDDCAYGGLYWADAAQLLRVQCALPLQAIQQQQPDRLIANVLLTTDSSEEPEAFKSAWQGFLKLYNLLQFVPAVGFATTAGAASGLYEGIRWRYAEAALNPTAAESTPQHNLELEAVLAEAVEELRDALKRLAGKSRSLPQVAYELQDEHGEIIAEAELAWPECHLVGLLDEQMSFATTFSKAGWRTVELGNDGQWVEQVMTLLGDFRE